MTPILPRLVALVAGLAAAAAAAPPPAWVTQRPVAAGWAVGIGVAEIDESAPAADGYNRALAAALQEIAGQVRVEVSGETSLRVHEDGAGLDEAYASCLRAAATAALEGVEIVATWSDGRRLWLYARLDLESRERRQQEHTAWRLARLDELSARMEVPAAPLAQVLAAGVEGLALASAGADTARRGQFLQRLRRHLGGLELTGADGASGPEDSGGLPALVVTLTAARAGADPSGLPVRFRAVAGNAEVEPRAWTDERGVAAARVAQLTGDAQVEATLDLGALAGVAAADLERLPLPTTRFGLEIPRRRAHLSGSESDLDGTGPLQRLRPDVAALLANHGIDAVGPGDTAQLEIDVQLRSTRGQAIGGVCFAFVDLTLTVADGRGGRLCAVTAPRVTGAGSSWAEAVRAALQQHGGRLGEVAAAGRRVRVVAAPQGRAHHHPNQRRDPAVRVLASQPEGK